MYNKIEKLASAIKNDVLSGLQGFNTNISMSDELLCQDIVDERMQVIKEYLLKGLLPSKDLYISINCIPIDCKDLERCKCNSTFSDKTPNLHFEIPLILNDYNNSAIGYIGSPDRLNPFIVYTSSMALKNHQYRKRGKNKPYVWIDVAPNENGMYDCFVFNAPLLKSISISAIFKDPRLLDNFGCCNTEKDNNISFIDNEIKKRLTEKKIRYYRALAAPNTPNDLQYK